MSPGQSSTWRRNAVRSKAPRLSMLLALSALSALAALAVPGVAAARRGDDHGRRGLRAVKHIVVIYEENHSFDNLYGGWEGVNGRRRADAAHTKQVNQAGNTYNCLKQNDVNLAALSQSCSDAPPGTPGGPFTSHFGNAPFTIDNFIKPADKRWPPNP